MEFRYPAAGLEQPCYRRRLRRKQEHWTSARHSAQPVASSASQPRNRTDPVGGEPLLWPSIYRGSVFADDFTGATTPPLSAVRNRSGPKSKWRIGNIPLSADESNPAFRCVADCSSLYDQ